MNLDSMYCNCWGAGGSGWSMQIGGLGHIVCGRLSRGWLSSDDQLAVESRQMLNIMQGGDQHNVLITTQELLSGEKGSIGWITSYEWTPDVIYGSESGTPARVWRAVDPDAS